MHCVELTATTIGAQKEQGIFSKHQGIAIPCSGVIERKFVSFFVTLSLKRPKFPLHK
jgi:hypothetical protein